MKILSTEDLHFSATTHPWGVASRLRVGADLVANNLAFEPRSAEFVTFVCEQCGTPGCVDAPPVQLSVCGGLVLWTVTPDAPAGAKRSHYPALRAFSDGAWRILVDRFDAIPSALLPTSNAAALLDVVMSPTDTCGLEAIFARLHRDLLASSTLSRADAIATLRTLVDDVCATDGHGWEVSRMNIEDEVLYLEGQPSVEWRVFGAVDGVFFLRVAKDLGLRRSVR